MQRLIDRSGAVRHRPQVDDRPIPGVRAAIVAIAGATFVGAGAVTEAAAAGMSWPLRAGTLAVLAVGLSSLVRIGLAQPLADTAVAELRRRIDAEADLDEIRSLDLLLGQVDGVLATSATDADVLQVVARAVATIVPERDNALLLSAPGATTVAWRAPVSSDGVGRPEPLDTPWSCLALGRGLVVVASTSQFDACPHAAADELATSSLCLPVEGAFGTLGVLWSTGPEGDLPSDAQVAALRRLVAAARSRLIESALVEATTVAPAPVAESLGAHIDVRDPLTGLPNHISAHGLIRDLVESLTPFSVALCNIDEFAAYNARNGRDGGDVALTVLAKVLGETLRPDDIVCRYGGDTFLAVFPHCSTLNAAAAMERVRESLVLRLTEEARPAFGCSTGVADSNQGTSIDELLEAADLAMSMAKYEGGNRVRTALFDLDHELPELPGLT